MPFALDPAQPADHAAMLTVWEASVRATHHFVSEADIQLFRPLVKQAFTHTIALVCARDANQNVLGFVGVAEGKIEMLFVDPAWRGQGVGKQLLRHAMETLKATQLDVNEQNGQAVGFYMHEGFIVAGRSAVDGLGKPYPLLHMQLPGSS